MGQKRLRAMALALLAAAGFTTASMAADDPVLWPEHQRAFFQDGAALLLVNASRQQLIEMDVEERDRFIAALVADPVPETPENELAVAIDRRRRLALQELATPLDDRAKLLFLHGLPSSRQEIDCGTIVKPIAIWTYGTRHLLLYQPPGRTAFRLWRPRDGKRVLYSDRMQNWFQQLSDYGMQKRRFDIEMCSAVVRIDEVTRTKGLLYEQPDPELSKAIDAFLGPPEDLVAWAIEAADTPLQDEKPLLDLAGLEIEFPYQTGQRVAVRFVLTLGPDAALVAAENGEDDPEVSIEVQGLLEYKGSVFEEFRVRFRRPPPDPGESVVLVFDRRLRPNREFVARILARDSTGGAQNVIVRGLSVPREVERVVEGAALGNVPVEEVAQARLEGVDSLVLVPPVTDGLSGAWRAEALVTGAGIRKVIFSVDEETQLTRTRPPYTADLRLAPVPVEQVVTATGLDQDGEMVAQDSVVLNKARGLFAVKLISPREGAAVSGSVVARADVNVPDDGRLEAIDFSMNEEPLVTLTKPPWAVPIEVDPSGAISYITVVARLEDGRRAEDVVFLNAPENLDRLDVGLVELFATVTDSSGRLIEDLSEEDFEVLEAGAPRQVQRFDRVHNLPLVVGFALDASSSMADHMATARQAAIGFLQSVLRENDRAFAVSFSDQPELVAPPTDDPIVVERALREVHSEGWTTLYDAVVRSLFYFRGFSGRRALVVLSDGEDTASRASFAESLRYAQQSGAVIYSISLGGGRMSNVRGKLKRLANETGGRFFHVATADELSSVYAQIERELRSQYFLTFVPERAGESDLSEVEVRVRGRGLKVRATRGYAP